MQFKKLRLCLYVVFHPNTDITLVDVLQLNAKQKLRSLRNFAPCWCAGDARGQYSGPRKKGITFPHTIMKYDILALRWTPYGVKKIQKVFFA